jgi:hypothetical protein
MATSSSLRRSPRQVAQRRAHALLDHRMIERHVQHLRHRQARLHGPGQQMAEVLGARADHLGAQEAAAAIFAVHPQHAVVLQHDAAAALVLERHLADRELRLARRAQLLVAGAQGGDLRLGEGDRQRRAAQARRTSG